MLARIPIGAALLVLMCATTATADVPRLGVMADVGAPDGAVASLVARPIRALRLSAGVGSNYVSRGVRAGITLIPFSTWLTPTLSVDYGRYFEGDANPLARTLTGDSMFSSRMLERVGYDYANAHVGIEMGRKRFTFYIHAGMSRITSDLHNLSMPSSDGSTSVTFSSDPKLTMWTPSARIGFILYLVK